MLPLLLVATMLTQEQEPIVPISRPGIDGRGRDPWVFRALFDDRSRMVLIAPKNDFWMVFNPDTCSMHRIWKGDVDFRGKVWDFSQDSSRAKGTMLFEAPNIILGASDITHAGWTADRVTAVQDGWKFEGDGAKVSLSVDTRGWQRIFAAFDEKSRKGRFRVNVVNEPTGKLAQWFESTTSVDSETNWQWNFKQIIVPEGQYRISIIQQKASDQKLLRAFRIFGDKAAWFDASGNKLMVSWKGYELIKKTKGVLLKYELILKDGKRVNVVHQPEVTTTGWKEVLTFSNPSLATFQLRRPQPLSGVRVEQDPPRFQSSKAFTVTYAYTTTGGRN